MYSGTPPTTRGRAPVRSAAKVGSDCPWAVAIIPARKMASSTQPEPRRRDLIMAASLRVGVAAARARAIRRPGNGPDASPRPDLLARLRPAAGAWRARDSFRMHAEQAHQKHAGP